MLHLRCMCTLSLPPSYLLCVRSPEQQRRVAPGRADVKRQRPRQLDGGGVDDALDGGDVAQGREIGHIGCEHALLHSREERGEKEKVRRIVGIAENKQLS